MNQIKPNLTVKDFQEESDKLVAKYGYIASSYQEGGTHYKDMDIEPWDVVDTWPLEQQIGAYRMGALKYLMRMGSKDEEIQEIRKCRHYLSKLLEVLETNSNVQEVNNNGS